MKVLRIRWIAHLDDPNEASFILVMDGTDFKAWEERNHPTLPYKRKNMSHKMNHSAYKYLIALSLTKDKVHYISGPHIGGKHDMTIFREELKYLIAPFKKILGDSGFATSRPDEPMVSICSTLDSDELAEFKRRGKLRLEVLNGRCKDYAILNNMFTHGMEKFGWAFEAILVTCQYKMDMGQMELFDP